MGNKDKLDKFYTKRGVSSTCVNHLCKLMTNFNLNIHDAVFVEPSAGDGTFIDALYSHDINREHIVSYDIEPKRADIKQADWFDTTPIRLNAHLCVVLGNPPFGVRSTLAKKFISHAISWNADVIAFILPDTFNRLTNQRCFGTYRLVDVLKLPNDAFILDGEDYHVPCSFFVLTSRSDVCPDVDLRDRKVPQPPDYSFLQRDDRNADFCINGNSGRVHDVSEITNPKSEHYIKVNNGYDIAAVRSMFENAEYDQLSSCNGGNWWINRNDINKAYLKAKATSSKRQSKDIDVSNIHTAIHNMFGDMRGSTDEERTAYSDMLDNISTPLDIDIFSD